MPVRKREGSMHPYGLRVQVLGLGGRGEGGRGGESAPLRFPNCAGIKDNQIICTRFY